MKKKLISLVLISVLGAISLVGCGIDKDNSGVNQEVVGSTESEKTDTVALDKIHDAVVAAYGDNYLATMSLEKDLIQERFGLTEDMYKNIVADIPMMSAHVDTFVAVETAEGKEEVVFDALSKYKAELESDSMMYPMNLLKVQASKVYKVDGYVFFIMLGAADDTLEEDAEILAHFEKQNEIAVDAINAVLNIN